MLALVIPLLLSFFLSFVCALPIVSRFLFICVHLVMNRLLVLLLASTAFVSALSPEDVCAKSCQKAIKSFRWSGCDGSRRATCCTSLNTLIPAKRLNLYSRRSASSPREHRLVSQSTLSRPERPMAISISRASRRVRCNP